MNRCRSVIVAWVGAACICGPQGAGLGAQSALAQPCEPAWSTEFPCQDVVGWVRCIVPVEENGQTVYYIGGSFTKAGGIDPCRRVARWDGTHWAALGTGIDLPDSGEMVYTIAQFDDGTGPAIFAAGDFGQAGGVKVSNIAKWDGSKWSPLGPGLNDTVRALRVWDDGKGPALYAAGFFTDADGWQGRGIVKWDGGKWNALGSGILSEGKGYSLGVFPIDGREQLILGGHFYSAGGVEAWDLAAWDGNRWSAMGAGFYNNGPHAVTSLASVDLGNGPEFYAGGQFYGIGDPGIRNICRWDGAEWVQLGAGVGTPQTWVSTIARFDDGAGPRLVVGGSIAGGFATWDGTTWVNGPLDSGNVVRTLLPVDSPSGPRLLMGGELDWGAARWDGVELLPGLAPGALSNRAEDLKVFHAPDGPRICVAGWFDGAGDIISRGVASLAADGWRPMALAPPDDSARSLAEYDDGTGPTMYAAGFFPSLDQSNPFRIARWDGSAWSLVPGPPVQGPLFVYDDGTGPALYARALKATVIIVRWDGASWTTLPQTLSAGELESFAEFDDGSGPALYIGGSFKYVDGHPAGGIARWDGTAWHPVGAGVDPPDVRAMFAWDDGRGPALYVGGRFTTAGGTAAANVAKWNGSRWSALGDGLTRQNYSQQWVLAFAAIDDGSGPALYAGGLFSESGTTALRNFARWDGQGWSEAFGGLSDECTALLASEALGTKSLWAAGSFINAGGVSSGRIARLIACPSCPADFDHSGDLDIDDFISFQTGIATGDPRADFNGNGVLDEADFIAFTAAFAVGCP